MCSSCPQGTAPGGGARCCRPVEAGCRRSSRPEPICRPRCIPREAPVPRRPHQPNATLDLTWTSPLRQDGTSSADRRPDRHLPNGAGLPACPAPAPSHQPRLAPTRTPRHPRVPQPGEPTARSALTDRPGVREGDIVSRRAMAAGPAAGRRCPPPAPAPAPAPRHRHGHRAAAGIAPLPLPRPLPPPAPPADRPQPQPASATPARRRGVPGRARRQAVPFAIGAVPRPGKSAPEGAAYLPPLSPRGIADRFRRVCAIMAGAGPGQGAGKAVPWSSAGRRSRGGHSRQERWPWLRPCDVPP